MEDAYKYLEATTDSDDFFVKDGCNDECEDEGWLLVERPVYGGVTDRKNSYGAQNAQPDTQKSQQEQEDGFVHVQPTLIVCARMCLHQHPTCTRALLWTWFGMLKLGELAATICWLKSLGFKESLMLEMALLLAFVTLCVMLTIRQVAAVLLSLVFTAIDGAWAYTMVALLMTALHVLAAGVGIVPILSVADMSKAILYTVGVLCAQLRAQTSALFGEELVPFLLGVDIVNKKTLCTAVNRHGRQVLCFMPNLRHFAPPRFAAALLVALQSAGPVLFASLAFLASLPSLSGPISSMVSPYIIMSIVMCVVVLAWFELCSVPLSPLHRIPMLLPDSLIAAVTPGSSSRFSSSRGVATRRMMGHVLVAGEKAGRVMTKLSSFVNDGRSKVRCHRWPSNLI